MIDFSDREKTAALLIRIGLCIVFLYAGISALISPENWINFVPKWVEIIMSKETFLMLHSIADIVVGLWLISGIKPFYSALVSGVMLIAIISGNVSQISIIFRNFALLFADIALMVLTYKNDRTEINSVAYSS